MREVIELTDPVIEDVEVEEESEDGTPVRKAYPKVREGTGFGKAISTETCPFCNGAGTVRKTGRIMTCAPCHGLGTRGGAGKATHPITLDIMRPHRTHMEEKPIED